MDKKMLKRSVCPECEGTVRVAGVEFLDGNTKARNEFKNEVFEYNLTVEEIELSDYQDAGHSFCNCE